MEFKILNSLTDDKIVVCTDKKDYAYFYNRFYKNNF